MVPLTLACLQVKFSILEQQPVKSGLVQACKDLNVSLVAHSPLAQGLLTGTLLHSVHRPTICPTLRSGVSAALCVATAGQRHAVQWSGPPGLLPLRGVWQPASSPGMPEAPCLAINNVIWFMAGGIYVCMQALGSLLRDPQVP